MRVPVSEVIMMLDEIIEAVDYNAPKPEILADLRGRRSALRRELTDAILESEVKL